jgi:hypothetical protein
MYPASTELRTTLTTDENACEPPDLAGIQGEKTRG